MPEKKSSRPTVWAEMLPTPLGPLWLSFSEHGLQTVSFGAPGGSIGPLWPVGHLAPELTAELRRWRQEATAAFAAYFAGRPENFDQITLDLQGTPFQLRVWEAVRRVPFGRVTTYQALANTVDLPRGARAVGNALGANPLPIIIPCHRVVASNGSLGGYSAGLQYKRQLLAWERQVTEQSSLPGHGPVIEA